MKIHPTLEKDLTLIGELSLCKVYMMPDSDNAWAVLVPKRLKSDGSHIREVYELSDKDQIELTRESSVVAKKMSEIFSADKMNVAALGNMVPQLHIHIICRYEGDKAWPGPIWGSEAGVDPHKIHMIMQILKSLCAEPR